MEDADTFDQAVQKIEATLKGQISDVFPVYKLFCEMALGKKSFSEWYPQVLEQAKLCNFTGYDYQKAARDAMTMQTENSKLRKYYLAEGPDFEKFVKQGLTLESSTAQAEKIEKSIGFKVLISLGIIMISQDSNQIGHYHQTLLHLSVIFVVMSQEKLIKTENVQLKEKGTMCVRRNTISHIQKFVQEHQQ